MLTLSEETRPIRGGFILSDGDVEVNCAFDVLVRMERERLEKDVADLLFAQ
jgi:V/A-type H+-transporting ATPase subunit E